LVCTIAEVKGNFRVMKVKGRSGALPTTLLEVHAHAESITMLEVVQ
jgi:hypothetical protein